MSKHFTHKLFQKGFTLVEVMVVVALVGILAGVLVENMTSSLGVARDARRKSDLRKLQAALATYYARNGQYPATNHNWYSSDPADFQPNNGGNWIPGLAPTFIPKLPSDPLGGRSTNPGCTGNPWRRAYVFVSDASGSSYKLVANCSPEQSLPVPVGDQFYDATPGYAACCFVVCSGDPACSW